MFIHLALQKLTCIANIYDDIYIYERRYTYRSMIVTRFSTAININDYLYSDNRTIIILETRV